MVLGRCWLQASRLARHSLYATAARRGWEQPLQLLPIQHSYLLEHTIGWLKGRWQCLKELRAKIKNEDDVQYACCWLRAAIILHQTAKWQERSQPQNDPFCEAGRAWEAEDRDGEGELEGELGAGEAARVGTSTRRAEIERADAFRDALKGILFKSKPPRASRHSQA
ncbi:hypothetical protein V8E36_004711 [Tilletia maclaganii]